MKYEVKRLGVISMMKLYFVVGLVVGLIYGVTLFLMIMFGALSTLPFTGGDVTGGVMALVIGFILSAAVVILFGVVQSVVGGICAMIYNLIAKTMGGLEVELRQKN